MSKGFMIFAVIMVLMAGIFHLMFIMFDYSFHNSESGAMWKLSDVVNESLEGDFASSTHNTSEMLRQSFGYGRVICIGIIPVAFAVNAFKRRDYSE
jgi:hypothetical protein